VTVHVFNQSWSVDMRWLLIAGLVLTAVGLFGLSMMRLGSARYMRLAGERRALAAENKRLTKRAAAADKAPRTAPAAQPRASVPSSERPGFREKLAATRHRLVGAERVGPAGQRRVSSS
jgi:hypothetical protein